MANINKNRLQLLYAEYKENDIVFPSIDKLKRHIMQRYELDSKLAEPFVAYYKNEEETRMVLCIGSGIDGEPNATGIENGYSIIDISEVENKLDELAKTVDNFDTSIEELKKAVKTLKEGLTKEIEDRKNAIKEEKSERVATDENISNVVGLTKNEKTNEYEFNPNIDDEIIKKSESIVDAINKISKFAQDNNIKYEFKESNVVKFKVEPNKENDKTLNVEADVKLSLENGSFDGTHDDNILVKKNDGLAAYIDLQYIEEINQETKKLVKGLEFTKSSTKLNSDDGNTTHKKQFIELPIPKIELNHEDGSSKYELIVDGESIGTINVLKDNFVDKIVYDEGNHELIVTYNSKSGKDSFTVKLDKLIDVYKNGDGLELNGNVFSVKKNPKSEDFLSVDKNGVSINGVENAISNAKVEAINKSNENTKNKVDDLSKKIVGIKEDGTDELTIHGVRNKIDKTLNDSKIYTNEEIVKVKEVIKSGDDKLLGSESDTSNSLTIHGVRKSIEDAKKEANENIENSLTEAKEYTDAEKERATSKENELLGKDTDSTEINSIWGVKNRVDSLNTETKTNLEEVINKNEEKVNASLKDIAKQIKEETEKLKESDTAIENRLGVIEGDGEGSIKKAVKDEAEARTNSINQAITTEEKLRKDSIENIKNTILGGVETKFNSLSKIAEEIRRETEARINGDKKVALNTSNTNSIKFGLIKSDETGNELSADVNVSTNNNNSLSILDNGLYVPQIDLEYEGVTNKLKLVYGNETKEIQLSGIQAIDDITYDPNSYELVFKIKKDSGEISETPVNLHSLVPTPRGVASDTITVKSNVVEEGGGLVQEISATLNAGVKDINGLEDVLSGKAEKTHEHEISDVKGLEVALENKANYEHRHNASEIDGTFQVTYVIDSDDITTQPHTFKTVDEVIGHILDMVKTLIERSLDQVNKLNELGEKITDIEKQTKETNENVEKLKNDVDNVSNTINPENGNGIYVSVKNDDGVSELRRYNLESGVNNDNSDVMSITNDKESNKFIIDVNNIDFGTY